MDNIGHFLFHVWFELFNIRIHKSLLESSDRSELGISYNVAI